MTEAGLVLDEEWVTGVVLVTVLELGTVGEREAGEDLATADDEKATNVELVTGVGWGTGVWVWIPFSSLSSSAPQVAASPG